MMPLAIMQLWMNREELLIVIKQMLSVNPHLLPMVCVCVCVCVCSVCTISWILWFLKHHKIFISHLAVVA